ncbi:hypothetical protein JCM8097_008047 [Rhodosporidiobolus ruineniae]
MTIPDKHTVFRVTARNSPKDVKAFEEAVPAIDDHEVLVQIKATSLNFRDIAIANGMYPFPVAKNVVPVSDAAGIVVKVGAKVDGFREGDRVVAAFDPTLLYGPAKDWDHAHGGPVDGMLRQYAPFTPSALIKVAESSELSFPELAALVCTGTTAWNALFGNLPIKPGQTVLFQGTGGVSITGLIIARALGARTIITSSSDDKLAEVKRKYGADFTINYKKTPDWASEALKLTGGEGVDYILENGGSGTIAQSIKATRWGGQVAVIGFLSQAKQEDMPDVASLALSRAVIVRGIVVGSKQLLEELLTFVGVKNLKPPVEKVFKFSQEDVVAAYEYMASGSHMGKVAISLE